jgi:hypothetical protein
MNQIDNKIQAIKDRYNADYDTTPDYPLVNWTDYQLLDLIENLYRHIQMQDEEIEALQRKTGYFDNGF